MPTIAAMLRYSLGLAVELAIFTVLFLGICKATSNPPDHLLPLLAGVATGKLIYSGLRLAYQRSRHPSRV